MHYDYINRLAFRIFFSQRFIQILSVGRFVLGHNLHEEIFSQLSSVLIVEFCSCYTEPHRLTCHSVSARKPKHETILLMDNKPRKIMNDLRLINLETNLAYNKKDFVLSALHKDRTDD